MLLLKDPKYFKKLMLFVVLNLFAGIQKPRTMCRILLVPRLRSYGGSCCSKSYANWREQPSWAVWSSSLLYFLALPNMFHEFSFTQNHNSKGKNPQSVHKTSPVFGSSRTTSKIGPQHIFMYLSLFFCPSGRRLFDSCLKIRRKKEGHAACKTQPVETHAWFRNGTVMLPSLSNLNLSHIAHNRDVCDPFLPISWK